MRKELKKRNQHFPFWVALGSKNGDVIVGSEIRRVRRMSEEDLSFFFFKDDREFGNLYEHV
jgi:hypothetical protein